MESGSIKDLARYRYEKALDNASLAKKLLEMGEFGFALNRAYYSLFDAMKAVNVLDGFDSSKHSGVIAHFNQEYVKPGIFPSSTSSVIRKASMLREKSDYEDFYEPDEEDAIDIVGLVEDFLVNVENHLRSQNVFTENERGEVSE